MHGFRSAPISLVAPIAAILSFPILLSIPLQGQAQDWMETTQPSLGIALGTSGLGIEAGVRPWEQVGARLALGWIPLSPDVDEDDVTGSVSFPSPITRLTLDFFPRSGVFRMSAGLHRFPGGISARAMARDSVEINDREYAPEELGEIEARVWGRENAPYLGFGWQARTGTVQPSLDLGVAFTGTPRIAVTVSGPAANDPTLRADLDAEIRDAEEDISSYRFFPHLAFGLRIPLGGGGGTR